MGDESPNCQVVVGRREGMGGATWEGGIDGLGGRRRVGDSGSAPWYLAGAVDVGSQQRSDNEGLHQ